MEQRMSSQYIVKDNEQGFVLVTAMLIMLVLTIIGIAGSRNTSMELLIAGNERTYKESFFEADGGAEVGQELLEQNLACITGFATTSSYAFNDPDSATHDNALIENAVFVKSNDFWRNFSPTDIPSDINADATYGIENRDIFFPVTTYGTSEPHTNLNVAGSTRLTTPNPANPVDSNAKSLRGAPGSDITPIHCAYDFRSRKSIRRFRMNSTSAVGLTMVRYCSRR